MLWTIQDIRTVARNSLSPVNGWPILRPGAGVEEQKLTVHAPLIDLTKAQIIQQGAALGVDYSLTVSCYQADDRGAACGRCESCFLRKEGFAGAGVPDPTRYANTAP